jgi:hypothetical protein
LGQPHFEATSRYRSEQTIVASTHSIEER